MVLRSVVVVGGSIAAVTAAETLRREGFDGAITVVADEEHLPYSRVPLSKGVLGGREPLESVALPTLGDDIVFRTGRQAVALHPERRRIEVAGGEQLPYDGLVIATGGRARRIGRPDQTGELVLRTRDDAERLSAALTGAAEILVVGGGVLGMEIASTCRSLGFGVTVVDREPPLQRLLGPWLADLIVSAARDRGVRFAVQPDGVSLLGTERIEGVALGARRLTADVVITACGDLPNTGWLESSGLAPGGLLIADDLAGVAPGVVAAGDVAARRAPDGTVRRDPFWTNAVQQGQLAARALLQPGEMRPPRRDPYFWTEHTGLSVKISGPLPVAGPPEVLAGSVAEGSGLLRWLDPDAGPTAVALNHRMSVVALKRLGALAALERLTS